MLHLIPAPLHRALLPLAHRIRRRWRQWRKVPLSGCSIIVTRMDGAVLLARHSYGTGDWCLPGGGLGRGEEPEACARRELREELGLAPPRFTLVGKLEETISGSPHTAHLYSCVSDEVPRIDGREIVEARFFPAHSLPEPLSPITRRRLELWRGSQQG
jgi:8-oxo-dGTP pyrophosphatase MutT (NUDIX family)